MKIKEETTLITYTNGHSNREIAIDVIKRTEKTATIVDESGTLRTVKIHTDPGGEYIKSANYSMAPVFRPSKESTSSKVFVEGRKDLFS